MDNPERVTYFAATDSRGKHIPFGIKAKDRDRHMYVIGKTGMGKSTLLENMAIQDLRNREGFAYLDPHGGSVDRLLEYIPEDRIQDVVYFAPFDMGNPIAFNVMEDVGYDKRHLVVSGLMATFKKIWEDAWSARMEYILTNTLLALLEYPDATLLGVNRMYTDKAYRQKVVENVKDPVVKDFWTKEFANYGDRYTQEATPAIQNKIGQFTGNPLIRNIIGQPKSSFDIRTMMDEKKILIINLSKGLVGETNMRLLGSMLTTRIFLAAMSRADLPAEKLERLPNFYFYVDEFQNFANETFAEILSEARKYKLNLVIAHQYIEQMEEEVRDAVFGNVGTTVVFRVGPFDAEVLETIFMPHFTKEDIVSLDKRQIYLTLMIDGVGSAPFSAVTIPPIEAPPVSYREEVIAASRARFAAPRVPIERAIAEEFSTDAGPIAHQDARAKHQPPVLQNMTIKQPDSQGNKAVKPFGERRAEVHDSRFGGRRDASALARRAEDRQTTPTAKNLDDLKSILREVTAKNTAEAEKSKVEQQHTLKETLSAVLAKNSSPSAPAMAEPPSSNPLVPKAEEKPPFEVPENELRKVLKGET
ncbi:type IV secretion system DNA-binding domain-containing protein [Patescibacteria group bacterium]|nr:type IV secretion system DNA-binding domain-containing protein [Patescibacteria group bacterium]